MNNQNELNRSSSLALLAITAVLATIGLLVEHLQLFPHLTFALQRTPSAMPSTTLVPAQEIARNFPLLSMYVDHEDLHDEDEGMLVHPMKRGLEWERRVFVSYFDQGTLRFASEAGIRVHGGKSRQHSPVQSYRLFFNSRYGADHFAPNVLFHDRTQPLRRLVVHNDLRQDTRGSWWHLVNPLAYDIARRVGCLTPDTKAARVFLNGKWQGVYVLTEHLTDRSYLKSHFGHDHFTYGNTVAGSSVWEWSRSVPTLDMAAVDQVVDLENLTQWAISVLFCATTDPFQGVMLRDDTNEGSRWFFVNWDMDHSFMDLYRQAPPDASWQHNTFRTVLKQKDLRSELITRLLNEDPAYREFFRQRLIDALNHQLTPRFLGERFEHYAKMARDYGVTSSEYQRPLLEFLRRRAGHLRTLSREYLAAGDSFPVRVVGPSLSGLEVDGYPVEGEYEGSYFENMSVRVRLTNGSLISGWRVNGTSIKLSGATLEVPIVQPTTIEAVIEPAT